MQRPALLTPLALACLFILVFASLSMQAQQSDPALATDHVRESTPNDFLRVTFVPAGVAVTTLARPGSLRAFATATAFYEPPLALKDFPLYSGLVNDDSKTLIAMRCQPPHPEAVDALLATWPNVFTAIQRDLPPESRTCNAENAPGIAANSTASTDDQRAFCFAHTYSDEPGDTVPITLAHTFSFAARAFAADTTLAQWLKTKYGIFPAFSGLGFSVKDSYYLDTQHPMNAQQILVKSISPEYILKNASLKEAGCRCISVAPYLGRADDPLDPDFIQQAGGDGECKAVDQLHTPKP
jgi:hypothetical protein